MSKTKKFRIDFEDRRTYCIQIEAENKQEAEDKFSQMTDDQLQGHEQDRETEFFEIEEIK